MNNKILIGLVVVLVVVLMIQNMYFWNMKKQLDEHKRIKQEAVLVGQPPFLSHAAAVRKPADRQKPFDQSSRQDSFFNTGDAESWDPFSEMDMIQTRMNRLFRDSFNRGSMMNNLGGVAPAFSHFDPDVDLQEADTHYTIKMDLPGMDKDTINLDVKDHYLEISGERKFEKEESKKDGFYHMERSFGSFSKTVPLPEDAKTTDVTAEYKNGVLIVTIPKLAPAAKTPASTTKIAIQ